MFRQCYKASLALLKKHYKLSFFAHCSLKCRFLLVIITIRIIILLLKYCSVSIVESIIIRRLQSVWQSFTHISGTSIHPTPSYPYRQVVLNKAVRSGYFTTALRQSGYPHADAKQALECTDVTPTPNPKSLTIVEVSQVDKG